MDMAINCYCCPHRRLYEIVFASAPTKRRFQAVSPREIGTSCGCHLPRLRGSISGRKHAELRSHFCGSKTSSLVIGRCAKSLLKEKEPDEAEGGLVMGDDDCGDGDDDDDAVGVRG